MFIISRYSQECSTLCHDPVSTWLQLKPQSHLTTVLPVFTFLLSLIRFMCLWSSVTICLPLGTLFQGQSEHFIPHVGRTLRNIVRAHKRFCVLLDAHSSFSKKTSVRWSAICSAGQEQGRSFSQARFIYSEVTICNTTHGPASTRTTPNSFPLTLPDACDGRETQLVELLPHGSRDPNLTIPSWQRNIET